MGRVRIPPVLRDTVNGSRELPARGVTVSEILTDLFAIHPQLGNRLSDDAGRLSAFVNVYINGKDIRLLDGIATPVGKEDVVILLPAMAGG
ncbi:MAG: MoaD/ThiS family protein [Chloroflexota bacterium]